MAELIDQLRLWIEWVIGGLGYPGLTMLMALEMVFPPIPSGVVLPMAGFLVNEGRLTLVGVVIAATIGSVIGALVLYAIGRWSDEFLIRWVVRRYGRYIGLSEPALDRALAFFARYGDLALLVGPVIPMLRSAVLLPAGMARVPLARLVVFTALGSAVWSTALAYAGSVLGANWPVILEYLEQYQLASLVLVLAAAAYLGVKIWRARRAVAAPIEQAS